jgi:hypothetical protein
MIYILAGTDTKKKRAYEMTLVGKREKIAIPLSTISQEILKEYASSTSLFGESPVVIISDLFAETELFATAKDLALLAESKTLFIFIEDSILASTEKKYQKYATVIHFDEKKAKQISSIDSFAVANAFARRDKVGAWVALTQSIESGVSPESISGILFWKIKTMILSGTRVFSREELIKHSRALVDLYHQAHSGERDFAVGLEQFILGAFAK